MSCGGRRVEAEEGHVGSKLRETTTRICQRCKIRGGKKFQSLAKYEANGHDPLEVGGSNRRGERDLADTRHLEAIRLSIYLLSLGILMVIISRMMARRER